MLLNIYKIGKTLNKIMQVKDCTLLNPMSCKEGMNIVEVARILRDRRQRRIIVVNENNEPIGIISTTDINNRVVAENKNANNLKAKDVMTKPIYLVCDVNENLSDIFEKMIERESFFCPVTKEGRLYGVLTYGELIKHVRHKNDS